MTTANPNPTFNIRRGDDRGRTRIGWLDSAHSFSFGRYHDPANMGYRALRVINDDRVTPGMGFGEHGHDNMEIITWVLDGTLRHGDSLANQRQLTPGEAQVMSAGSGIRHSEFNGSETEAAHFLQVWIEPNVRDAQPRYAQRRYDPAGRANQFQAIASGRGADRALPIHQDAEVWVADLSADGAARYDVAAGRHAYLHVATGRVTWNGADLSAGDAVTLEAAGEIVVRAAEASQVMLFDLA